MKSDLPPYSKGKRKSSSMGRYPFLIIARKYIERRRGFIAASSFEELSRKGIQLNRVLVRLKKDNRISTTNPTKITTDDVAQYIVWMREQNYENSYIAKNLGYLKQICTFAGNKVFEEIKGQGERLPTKIPKELRSLTEEELKEIFRKADSLKGWYGEMARFIVHFLPYTGVRPNELRLARIEDVDIDNWTFTVQHPKGEFRYARRRKTPILPPAREAVLRFLRAREERLLKAGITDCHALIPSIHSKKPDTVYSRTRFRHIKNMIEELVEQDMQGFKFQLKMFRDTFIQMNIDKRPDNLMAVSVSVGHATTRTTELFYGRLRMQYAVTMLQDAWQDDTGPDQQNRNYGMTGYM